MVLKVSYINRKQSMLNKSEQSLLILIDKEFSVWENKRWGGGNGEQQTSATSNSNHCRKPLQRRTTQYWLFGVTF